MDRVKFAGCQDQAQGDEKDDRKDVDWGLVIEDLCSVKFRFRRRHNISIEQSTLLKKEQRLAHVNLESYLLLIFYDHVWLRPCPLSLQVECPPTKPDPQLTQTVVLMDTSSKSNMPSRLSSEEHALLESKARTSSC